MDALSTSPYFHNWQRKLIALVGAIAIWLFVNQSITETKAVANVPVRLVNLPAERTVEGLLPNGILSKRVTLTLTGTKDTIDSLEPSDLEVVVDAASLPDESILQVSKKNLISLNPDIDPTRTVSAVESSEFVIKLSKLITEQIPITIAAPLGQAPEGYQFLDIWPQQLHYTITGPEEQIRRLQEKGLHLTFDLNKISKAELDALEGSSEAFRGDEVIFPVPDSWKKIVLPFDGDEQQPINDPTAKELAITLLRKQPIALQVDVPVRVFYPVDTSALLNPKTHPLTRVDWLAERNSITLTSLPLFTRDVSEWFVDVVRNNIEITIVAADPKTRSELLWGIEFVNLLDLEDTFVAFLMADHGTQRPSLIDPKKKEARLRRRFRDYVQIMRLYKGPEHPLQLECRVDRAGIVARDITPQ